MLPLDAVIDPPPAGAVLTAATQLRVEGVDHLGLKRADLDVPDERADVLVDVVPITADGALPAIVHRQVPIEQLVDRRAGARVTALADLGQQPSASFLGPILGAGAGRDDLP